MKTDKKTAKINTSTITTPDQQGSFGSPAPIYGTEDYYAAVLAENRRYELDMIKRDRHVVL